jgi:hypothetical protein
MIIDTRRVCRVLQIGLALLALAFTAPPQALAQCVPTDVNQRATAIAGHAFENHQAEFVQGRVIARLAFPNPSITTEPAFATFIAGIINAPSASKPLENNRTAYWHTATGTLVILNLAVDDCGTAFRPNVGRLYYNNLQ